MREVHYTFVLKLPAGEDEEFEGDFQDGLAHVLESVQYIDPQPTFDLTLLETVVSDA